MTSYNFQSKLPTKTQQKIQNQECLCEELTKIIDDFVSRLCVGTVDDLDELCKGDLPENAKILYLDNKGVYKLDELLAFLLGIYTEMYSNVYYNDRVSFVQRQ